MSRHHQRQGAARPVQLDSQGAVGSPVVPACPRCGQCTDRVDATHRVCPDGHGSTVEIHGRHSSHAGGWLAERWSLSPL